MYTANDKSISEAQIPIVDITALRLGLGSKKVGDLLHKASQEFGFIYIIGHGIPIELIEKTRRVSLKPLRVSMRSCSTEKQFGKIAGASLTSAVRRPMRPRLCGRQA